jgi:NAD(P) transhydrogenase subunit alpha
MYSSNLFNLIDEFWDEESKSFKLDFENEIIKGCVITHEGEIVNETIKKISDFRFQISDSESES